MDPRGSTAEQLVVSPGGRRDGGVEARQELGRDELEALPEMAHDPLLSAGRMTSVTTGEGSGSLHVRGGAGDEVGIVLDGLELYSPYHLPDRGGPISAIDSRNVAGVELLGGAFPAEYGGYMSGVINLDTVGPDAGQDIELAYGTTDSRVVGRGALGRDGHWMLAVRRGDPSTYLEAIGADPSYHPRYWDAFGKASWRLGRRTSLSVDVLHAYDEVEGGDRAPVQTTEPPGTFRSLHTSSYVWATVESVWSPRWTTKTLLSVGALAGQRDGSSAPVADISDDRSTEFVGLRHDSWFRSGRHLWKWGVEGERLAASYRYRSTASGDGVESRDIRVVPSGGSVGLYAADRIEVTDALDVELGVRWDGQSWVPGGGSVNPRANLAYAIGDRTTLRAGWGYFSQAPRIDALQVEDGVTDFHGEQRAEHRVIGLDHLLGGRIRIAVAAYQKLVDDPSPRFENLLDPGGFLPEADADRVQVDATRARAEGIEVEIRSAGTGRVQWRAGYAWARAEDQIAGQWVPRAWDQRHTLDFSAVWSPAHRWTVSAGATYHTGRPTTPVSAVATIGPGGAIVVDPDEGARNTERLPGYARLDLGVGRLFSIQRTSLRAHLNVTNLLDSPNPYGVEGVRVVPAGDGSMTLEPVYRDGLGRMVTAGLTWKF
jgi:hypothetical protein